MQERSKDISYTYIRHQKFADVCILSNKLGDISRYVMSLTLVSTKFYIVTLFVS